MASFSYTRFRRWYDLAKEDLRVAELLLREGLYHISAFHSHQAVEKALKGLVHGLGENPLKTHVLLDLVEQLDILGVKIPEDLVEYCRDLEPHYFTSRYPDLGPHPTKYYNRRLAEELLGKARRILDFVERIAKEKIGERGEGGKRVQGSH